MLFFSIYPKRFPLKIASIRIPVTHPLNHSNIQNRVQQFPKYVKENNYTRLKVWEFHLPLAYLQRLQSEGIV